MRTRVKKKHCIRTHACLWVQPYLDSYQSNERKYEQYVAAHLQRTRHTHKKTKHTTHLHTVGKHSAHKRANIGHAYRRYGHSLHQRGDVRERENQNNVAAHLHTARQPRVRA